jgi:hypothetical protein
MKRKQRKFPPVMLAAVCIAISIQGFAAPNAARTTSSDRQPAEYFGFAGYLFPIDFNLFVGGLFKILTNDTAEAAEVNDLPIAYYHDDDPDGFDEILASP